MPEKSKPADLVEIVYRSVEAMNRGDVDEVVSYFRTDSVWDLSPMGLGSFASLSAIRGFLEDWTGSYEQFELVLEEVRDLGVGAVFVVVLQRGRLAESAGEVRMRYASVNLGVDGQFVRIVNYPDIDQARAAAERLAAGRADG